MPGQISARIVRRLGTIVIWFPEWMVSWLDRIIFGRPALAVPAYMTEQVGRFDSNGEEMTRAWLFRQWARIAAAGSAVRVVVVEGSVRGLQPSWATYQAWINALDACRTAGQQVYGYVPVNGGQRPPSDVANEVQQWKTNVGGHIDGIYLDEGPTSCNPSVATNYRQYSAQIRGLGRRLFVLAPQWPDNTSNAAGQLDPWMRSLDPDFIQLWEEGVTPYETHYGALEYCSTQNVIPPPSWWTDRYSWLLLPGPPSSSRHSVRRVHAINDCLDAATMRKLIPEAMTKGARTVWITHAPKVPILGSVYGELPTYWDDMVAFVHYL